MTLGLLLLLCGIGLAVAVLTTRQETRQFITAEAQIAAGGVILVMTPAIWRQELRGIAVSAGSTIALSAYLVLTSYSSELIAVLQLYLLVLLAFAYRGPARSVQAA